MVFAVFARSLRCAQWHVNCNAKRNFYEYGYVLFLFRSATIHCKNQCEMHFVCAEFPLLAALYVCVWFCCTFLLTNCFKILLWRMVRGRTLSSLNIPVVRILVLVLHLFGAFFKTIHFGRYRKMNQPSATQRNSKMYCKTHVFDNYWNICESSQATQIIAKHNASCHQTVSSWNMFSPWSA